METLEKLKQINGKIVKHPNYKTAMKKYYQAEMVNDRYARATDKYYPGESSVPREERDVYYDLIRGFTNRLIFYTECIKSLLTEEERKDDCQTCINIFRKSIDILKKQLLSYK